MEHQHPIAKALRKEVRRIMEERGYRYVPETLLDLPADEMYNVYRAFHALLHGAIEADAPLVLALQQVLQAFFFDGYSYGLIDGLGRSQAFHETVAWPDCPAMNFDKETLLTLIGAIKSGEKAGD